MTSDFPEESGVQLYDTIGKVVRPPDQETYAGALKGKSEKTAHILGFVRKSDRPSFLKVFGQQFESSAKPKPTAATGALKPRLDRAGSLVRKGHENLRQRGFRDTLSKVRKRLARQNELLKRIVTLEKATVPEKHLLAYLAILQRDIDRKHAQQMDRLERIEEELRAIRKAQEER